jgi:peptidyl-prolyl cis-trans isomerase B (cyclophilin B)
MVLPRKLMDVGIIITLITMVFLFGCTAQDNAAGSVIMSNKSNTTNTTGVNMTVNPIVVFETTKGTFTADIYEKEAPVTSGNFLQLVNSGFYDNLAFHRYEQNFVIQGGDPNGDGTGGSKKTIPLEVKANLKHDLGALSMARTNNPDSASSQFFVVIGEAHFLDMQYAVFGKVKTGMDVVMNIREGDKMNKVYVQK